MAVRIRMKRMGRRHRPFYRICVMDSRKPRDGKAIEELGHYDPMVTDKSKRVVLKLDRVDYWISVGATPSDKVATLIKKVRTGTFGTAAAPAPMTAPKPLPEPEPEETTEATAETSTEEAAAEETPAKESAAEETPAEEASDAGGSTES